MPFTSMDPVTGVVADLGLVSPSPEATLSPSPSIAPSPPCTLTPSPGISPIETPMTPVISWGNPADEKNKISSSEVKYVFKFDD
jgi:hypothetical protein